MASEQEHKLWKFIYPVYIDKHKTTAEGRKVPRAYCCESPNAEEIARACCSLGLPCVLEVLLLFLLYLQNLVLFQQSDQTHQSNPSRPGRVRVQLQQENGKTWRKDITNRMFAYSYVCMLFNWPQVINSSRCVPSLLCKREMKLCQSISLNDGFRCLERQWFGTFRFGINMVRECCEKVPHDLSCTPTNRFKKGDQVE